MANLYKILLGTGLAITLVSCGALGDNNGNNYPNNRNNYPNNRNNYPNNGNNNQTVYRANDGQVYRRGEVYRDRNGTIYQNGRVVQTGDVRGNPGILVRNGNNKVYYPKQNQRQRSQRKQNNGYGKNSKNYENRKQVKFKKNNNKSWASDRDGRREKDDDNYKKFKKNDNRNYKKDNDRDDD